MDNLLHVVGTQSATTQQKSLSSSKSVPYFKRTAGSGTALASQSPGQTSSCAASPSLVQLLKRSASIALSYRHGLTGSCRGEASRLEQRRQILQLRMSEAKSAAQWEEAARELDKLEGNDVWKDDPATGDYSANLIESRLRQLDAARANRDVREMLFLIRNTLSRDLGGMGSADLYRYSYTGTKRIIERYVESAVKTIEALVDRTAGALPKGMRHQNILDELVDTRQNFGRTGLMLSGGATYGMTHIGVIKTLFEAKLLPRVISGASAGSIICAVLCIKTDAEIPEVLDTFPHGDLAVFDEQGNEGTFAGHVRKLLTEGSWSNIDHLKRVMRNLLGDITFQEAYNRTRRICNITVSSASVFELPRLLNYFTAPDVLIWSAVAVSCSVPVLFQASHLLVKDPITGEQTPWNPSPQRWIDGSVDNDLPTARLAEMFSVNHFIVSQVNPHVVPFLTRDDKPLTLEERAAQAAAATDGVTLSSVCKRVISTITTLAKDEALYRLNFAAEMGVFPNLFTKLCSILSQKYSGDITIIPDIDFQDLPRILKNPTTDFMVRSCLIGEKATWPKLRRIRDHCAIELAIDRAIHDLRTRAAFSPSQVNLRRMGALTRAGEVGQPITKLHHRERRRSGGSLQLLVRQSRNRGELEQIMTDNESRLGDEDCSSGSEDEEDDMLILDASRIRRGSGGIVGAGRKKRAPSSSSSLAVAQQNTGAAAASSSGEGNGGSLLKPVLRRATRSHHALPVTMRSKLSTTCVPQDQLEQKGGFPEVDAHGVPLMTDLSSEFVRVGSPARSSSIGFTDKRSFMQSAFGPPLPFLNNASQTGGARSSPSPSPSPSLPHSPTPPKRPAARLDILSPTDETTFGGDSSVFDADVDSHSENNSFSDPDLDGGEQPDEAPPPPPPNDDKAVRGSRPRLGSGSPSVEDDLAFVISTATLKGLGGADEPEEQVTAVGVEEENGDDDDDDEREEPAKGLWD